jgi:ABC-type multidrug transport system fused ATPase/permease subunit
MRYSVALGVLSILDGLALGLLATVITPLVSQKPLNLPILGEVDTTGQVIVLGVVCVLIAGKSAIALTLMWFATRRFAQYELAIGQRLFESYINAPWVERLKKNSAEMIRLADSSVWATIAAFLLPGSTLLGEALSAVTVIAVLAVAQPLIALVTVGYLGLLAVLLFVVVTRRSRVAGRVNLTYSVRTVRLLTEMLGALKEVTLRNKSQDIADVVSDNRRHATRARSNIQFLAQIPRYVLDAGLVGGFVAVGFVGFLIGGWPLALTAIALFGVAGFRMAPSVVRFQGVISSMTANSPQARAVLDEIRRAEDSSRHLAERPQGEVPEYPRVLRFEDVTFRYEPDAEDAVSGVTLEIPFGSNVAFVGSSGAGKSTMIDLILGLIEPTSGRILIDDLPLHEITRSWRARVGYVPQDVSLFDSTVAQNVALSWRDDVDRDRVVEVLDQAQLLDAIEARPGGVDSDIGERGLALSGGQKQRLGIARALYSRPLVLVLDEATSALDTRTEAAVTDALARLAGSTTLITVAHRLATIRRADRIFFMSGGRVAASGTFEELVDAVPEFAMQARLAGLLED